MRNLILILLGLVLSLNLSAQSFYYIYTPSEHTSLNDIRGSIKTINGSRINYESIDSIYYKNLSEKEVKIMKRNMPEGTVVKVKDANVSLNYNGESYAILKTKFLVKNGTLKDSINVVEVIKEEKKSEDKSVQLSEESSLPDNVKDMTEKEYREFIENRRNKANSFLAAGIGLTVTGAVLVAAIPAAPIVGGVLAVSGGVIWIVGVFKK